MSEFLPNPYAPAGDSAAAEFKILPQARWLWAGNPSFDIRNAYVLFRRRVRLEQVPESAPTLITADQSYQLYINGHFVCRGPARGYQRTWPCDVVDVAAWLRQGENVIAVRAHNPGFSTYQYRFEGFTGFLFMGRWGGLDVVSNADWCVRRQDGIARDTVPSSLQLFAQEHVDGASESGEWFAPEYGDSGWDVPSAGSSWKPMPWYSLEARGIPLLEESVRSPHCVLGCVTGVNAAGAMQPLRNVLQPIRQEDNRHSHTAAAGQDVRILEVPAGLAADAYYSVLYDFGHTVVGNTVLDAEGGAGGEIVDFAYAETLMEEPAHDWQDSASAGAAPVFEPRFDQPEVSLGSRIILPEGRARHAFYHVYGFRYLMVRVRGAESGLRLRISLQEVGYPLQGQGAFESSDQLLNRIWQSCRQTQQVCSLDAYVDTPWREQAQWWGDARVQAWNTFHLKDDSGLLRRGILSIARQTTPDGLTYGHAPTMAHHCILPDFTIIWVLTLWDEYWQSGRLDTFANAEVQQVLQGVLDYFRRYTDPATGLIRYDERHWLFLDWTQLPKDGQPALLSLWLLLALDKLVLLYRYAGQAEQAAGVGLWAMQLRKSLRNLYQDASGLYADGYDCNGLMYPSASLHTQVLALLAGLPRNEQEQRCLLALPAAFIEQLQPPAPHSASGPSLYWLTYVFTALDTHLPSHGVVGYIRRYWEPMARHGTTWSQLKAYGGMQSHSHAWSAHPLYHLMQILGGIRQRAAGWTEIEFRPSLDGDFAEVTVPTPHGAVVSSWHRDGSAYRALLSVPDGITARVILPGVDEVIRCAGQYRWVV